MKATVTAATTGEGRLIDRAEAERLILARGWLADQSDDMRRSTLKVARLILCPAGDFVFHAGDSEGGLYGVVSGGVGVHLPAETGEMLLAHVLRSGAWFGYGPLVRGQMRRLSFSLMEPSLLFHLPLASAQEIAGRSPLHQRAVLSVSEYGMDIATRVVETLLIRKSDRRIAATLLRVAPPEETSDGLEIQLTQAQLGEMANADRQVVNRVLKRLEAEGWLHVSYGRIRITDPSAIRSFVRAG
jgi:CRP-like cAMP-binding protein